MRYLPHTDEIRKKMLQEVGVNNVDDLFSDIPKDLLIKGNVDLPTHKSEIEVEKEFKKFKAKTKSISEAISFLGAGAYNHHIPAAVDHLIQRGEYLTSYTPYQPEVSQGTLQYLFEFQTQVCLLTGMEVANASMYDGATATLEAVLMANRLKDKSKVLLSGNLHPHYAEVIKTYAHFANFDAMQNELDLSNSEELKVEEDLSCVVVQYPDFLGNIKDFSELAEECHKKNTLLIICFTEVVSLGMLKSPGQMGADIVVGEGQSLGVGLNFGGPTVGLFATRKEFVRQMPGRVSGQTTDVNGKRGWVLTLSTREQHIRREKATSNICTNSGLCALAFSIHCSLLGEEGFKRLAKVNHEMTVRLYNKLSNLDKVKVINKSFFNELVVELHDSAKECVNKAVDKGVFIGVPLSRFFDEEKYKNYLLIACTELTSDDDIDELCKVLKG
jgi:glycine dehydrogenase subunit 1